jgi:hypothetical protein
VRCLTDALAESEETVVWLRFAADFGYVSADWHKGMIERYRRINAGIVRMKARPEAWATA